ncbi:MAG TPA: J domain-containing protein [Candidatus Dormibacteraeota bacterium]|nr:J domain-containing protein [Candidatus Dormibacteraeota bacterium]
MERAHPDYYRVLQVDPAANPLVVQAAYRALAQIFHPDVFGDEDEMKRINAAWEVLGDPRRRREYDIERAGRHPGTAAREYGSSPSSTSSASERPAASASTSGDGSLAGATNPPSRTDDHAGPPRGTPFGPLIRFGRYEGWTLGQIARIDRPWLEWLKRVPAGRGLKDEIDAVLQTRKGPGAVDEARHYETNRHKVHTWAPGAPTRIR